MMRIKTPYIPHTEDISLIIKIDNFFDNPNEIRKLALNYNNDFTPPGKNHYWVGFRNFNLLSEIDSINLEQNLKKVKNIPQNLSYKKYFHYYVKSSVSQSKCSSIHIDPYPFAGVIFLSPNPPKKSGIDFFDSFGQKIFNIENVYNRLVFYPGNFYHSPEGFFGTCIEDSRLIIAMFAYF